MKTENLLLFGLGAFLLYKFINRPIFSGTGVFQPYPPQSVNAVPPTGTTINSPISWVSCDSPNADPVMCSIMSQPQGGVFIN